MFLMSVTNKSVVLLLKSYLINVAQIITLLMINNQITLHTLILQIFLDVNRVKC